MAEDASGKTTHLGGKIKEGVGELLGDRKLRREGKLDQVEGEAEQDQARAERAAEDAAARRVAAKVEKERTDI